MWCKRPAARGTGRPVVGKSTSGTIGKLRAGGTPTEAFMSELNDYPRLATAISRWSSATTGEMERAVTRLCGAFAGKAF